MRHKIGDTFSTGVGTFTIESITIDNLYVVRSVLDDGYDLGIFLTDESEFEGSWIRKLKSGVEKELADTENQLFFLQNEIDRRLARRKKLKKKIEQLKRVVNAKEVKKSDRTESE